MWWKPQKRETTDVWPLASSLDFFSLFSLPSSSRLPQSLAGLPSCHIVLERVLNYVLSSCHPVFSPTIHPSIHPSNLPPSPTSLCIPTGISGWPIRRPLSLSMCVCKCVLVCICVCVFWDSNKCQVGIYRWAVTEQLQMLSGLCSSTGCLSFPLCAFFLARCVLE